MSSPGDDDDLYLSNIKDPRKTGFISPDITITDKDYIAIKPLVPPLVPPLTDPRDLSNSKFGDRSGRAAPVPEIIHGIHKPDVHITEKDEARVALSYLNPGVKTDPKLDFKFDKF